MLIISEDPNQGSSSSGGDLKFSYLQTLPAPVPLGKPSLRLSAGTIPKNIHSSRRILHCNSHRHKQSGSRNGCIPVRVKRPNYLTVKFVYRKPPKPKPKSRKLLSGGLVSSSSFAFDNKQPTKEQDSRREEEKEQPQQQQQQQQEDEVLSDFAGSQSSEQRIEELNKQVEDLEISNIEEGI